MEYVDETAAPADKVDGGYPDGKCGWQWVQPTASAQLLVSAVVTVLMQGLSRSTATATAATIDLLGNGFGGIVVSDRFFDLQLFLSGAASAILGACDSISHRHC